MRRWTANELIDANITDPAAQALAVRIHGRVSVKFSSDPKGREFDAVSHLYVAQYKPADYRIGSDFRNQAKATFEWALQTGRRPYFHFEGPLKPEVIRKLQEYGVRYGIQPTIDTRPLGG
ncbi:restriction endonuclease fold toxin [Solwaraspora sp. WMMB335]|uniref:restriction endonuclease fold toxin n=1 Tax=Solwaraspora sp. WMMB335 TaxID=3404118 RepID=UPI003B93A159